MPWLPGGAAGCDADDCDVEVCDPDPDVVVALAPNAVATTTPAATPPPTSAIFSPIPRDFELVGCSFIRDSDLSAGTGVVPTDPESFASGHRSLSTRTRPR
jgi:hypothetical protein